MFYVWLHFSLLLGVGFLKVQRARAALHCSSRASHCGGVSLWLHRGTQAQVQELQQLQRTMEQTGTPIIGCVINNVTLSKLDQKRYYYQYSYSGYGENSQRRQKKSKA